MICVVKMRLPVAPLAGAWIEILLLRRTLRITAVAPLAGAWIEIVVVFAVDGHGVASPPSRGRGLK